MRKAVHCRHFFFLKEKVFGDAFVEMLIELHKEKKWLLLPSPTLGINTGNLF